MEKRIYAKTGEKISLLGLGCMRLPRINPEAEPIDYAAAQEIVDYAYAHGINYFDTAYMYHGGDSQVFIGQALKKYPRDSYILTNKLPIWMAKDPADMERIFNDQLEKCQVDYFDFYLLHNMNKDSYAKSLEFGLYEFLKQKKEEGKIGQLGFSFHDSPELLRDIVGRFQWDFAQIQLNYLDWELQDAKQQYEILTENHIPVVIMEPVRGGALADLGEKANAVLKEYAPDRSIASWALRFAASLPNVLTVLSGMSSLEQIEDNVAKFEDFQPLSDEEREVLAKALEIYKNKDRVPCTGCRYCMDCPSGVDIPAVFKIYNQYVSDRDTEAFLKAYDGLGEDAQAHNCVACGAFTEQCPQSIDIPGKMAEISKLVAKKKSK